MKNPFIPLEIVEWLEAKFSTALPERAESYEDLLVDIGSAKVVRFVRRAHEQQLEKRDPDIQL